MYKMYDQTLYENSCLAFPYKSRILFTKRLVIGVNYERLKPFGKAPKILVVLIMVKIIISSLHPAPLGSGDNMGYDCILRV